MIKNITFSKERSDCFFNDLVCALLIVAQTLFGVIGINSVALTFSIVLAVVALFNLHKLWISTKYIFFTIIIVSIFLLSIIIHGTNSFLIGYIERFLLYAVIGCLFFSQQIDTKRVFRIVCLFSIVLIPLAFVRVVSADVYKQSEIYMSWSYSLFPLFCISCLSIKYRYVSRPLSILIAVSLLFFFFRYGTRGIFLSLALFFFALCVFSFRKERLIKTIVLVIVFGLVVFLITFNFNEIINWISEKLNDLGVRSWGLEKMLLKINNAQIDNGRNIVLSDALKGILDNPFGHLISSFENQYGTHTHNLFIQAMYEFGFVGVISCVVLLNYSIKKSYGNSKDYHLTIILLVCSFGVLIVSSTYWDNPFFWFLIANVFFAKKSNMKYYKSEIPAF